LKAGSRLRLQEGPLRVLHALLDRPGEIVTREELQHQLWPDDTFVDFDNGLNSAVNPLRAAMSPVGSAIGLKRSRIFEILRTSHAVRKSPLAQLSYSCHQQNSARQSRIPAVKDGHLLSTHLWDLRAQAEAKLRCLTRLQQLFAEYERSTNPADRARKRAKILEDLTDIVTISKALRSISDDALEEARRLA
jgi:DNA-binding winged helix-turn-helix (wHTH) protein